jgi:3-hydroxyacyl-CoA dehydrogenase, NAD binding domain
VNGAGSRAKDTLHGPRHGSSPTNEPPLNTCCAGSGNFASICELAASRLCAIAALTTARITETCDHHEFTLDMKQALSEADFVQENGLERQEFKIKLFSDMDVATPPDSIIASSSSGLTSSERRVQNAQPLFQGQLPTSDQSVVFNH